MHRQHIYKYSHRFVFVVRAQGSKATGASRYDIREQLIMMKAMICARMNARDNSVCSHSHAVYCSLGAYMWVDYDVSMAYVAGPLSRSHIPTFCRYKTHWTLTLSFHGWVRCEISFIMESLIYLRGRTQKSLRYIQYKCLYNYKFIYKWRNKQKSRLLKNRIRTFRSDPIKYLYTIWFLRAF